MKGIPTFALTFHLCIIIINSKSTPIYAIVATMVSANAIHGMATRHNAITHCAPYNKSK